MSAPVKSDGIAPCHRTDLPRKRVKKNYEFRTAVYAELARIRQVDKRSLRKESETAAIERLILAAARQLPQAA